MKKLSGRLDPVFGIPLEEDHAFPKAKALKTLDEFQDQITDHLILLYTAKKDAPEIPGWERELNAWRSRLVRRNRGKGSKQNFSREDLVKALWTEPFDTQADRDFIVAQVSQAKAMKLPKVSGDAFKRFVARFIQSIESDTVFRK